MSKKKRHNKKRVNLSSLEQINLNAAGLDIGAEEIWGYLPLFLNSHGKKTNWSWLINCET